MTMTMPPAVLRLRIESPDRTPVRLWLPLFLLWPLVVLLMALPVILAALADILLWLTGQHYHHYSVLIVRTLGVLGEAKGTVMRFNHEGTTVDMTVE